MKRAIVIAISMMTLVMVGAYANAQEQSRKQLAEELMTLMNARQNIEQSFAMIKQMVTSEIQKMAPPIGQAPAQEKLSAMMDKMMDLMAKEFSWDRLKDDYVDLYAEVYSEQELKDLIAFFKTPSGQALVKKQPELMQRSMEVNKKIISQVMPKIQALANEMEESAKSAAPSKPEAPKQAIPKEEKK
jgi:uncharacterized protein